VIFVKDPILAFKKVLALAKYRISLLTGLSALTGFALNGGSILELKAMILFLGTLFVSGFAGGVNQLIEVFEDSVMKRTQKRPLVEGVLSVPDACLVLGTMGLVGLAMLNWLSVNVALVSVFSWLIYNFLYTPLKQKTPFSIWVGALAGALPILGGALAQNVYISSTVWALFAVQFLWQIPHFFALGIKFKQDYEKAGFKLIQNSKLLGSEVIAATFLAVGIGLTVALQSKNILFWCLVFNLSVALTVSVIDLILSQAKEAGDLACKTSIVYLSIFFIGIWFA